MCGRRALAQSYDLFSSSWRPGRLCRSARRSTYVFADFHSGYISVDGWLESMMRLSALLRVALIVPSIFLGAELLSACAVSSTANTTVAPATIGLVTGTAEPCIAVSVAAEKPVTVTLRKGSQMVTSQSVRYPHRFLLSAQPGRYELYSSATTSRPHSIRIRAGLTTHVNLTAACK